MSSAWKSCEVVVGLKAELGKFHDHYLTYEQFDSRGIRIGDGDLVHRPGTDGTLLHELIRRAQHRTGPF